MKKDYRTKMPSPSLPPLPWLKPRAKGRICIFVCIFVCFSALKVDGSVFNAHSIRKANHDIKIGKLDQAEAIYEHLDNNKRIAFNKGFLYAKKNDGDKSTQYYQMAIQDPHASKKEKARSYFNLGNNNFRNQEFDKAIAQYRQGLLSDPKNKRLKYNLELANMAKLMPKSNPKSKKNNQDKDQNKNNKNDKKQSKSQDQAKETPGQKNAKKILDAFKQKELENLRQSMQKKAGKIHVEKDW